MHEGKASSHDVSWLDDRELVVRSFSRPNGGWWLAAPFLAAARGVFLGRFQRALLD